MCKRIKWIPRGRKKEMEIYIKKGENWSFRNWPMAADGAQGSASLSRLLHLAEMINGPFVVSMAFSGCDRLPESGGHAARQRQVSGSRV